MDFQVLARLFESPPEEFVAARNALARELRAAGKAEESKEVAALRKPSKALWLVNQLARRAPKDLAALIEATGRMREAQEKSLSGDVLREAMGAQRDALAALSAAAADPALDRRIRDTLQAAAMSDPDALREGRLLEELQPSGFDALLASGVAPAPPRPGAHGEKSPAAPDKKRERALRTAEAEAEKVSARAAELEKVAHAAQIEADKARKSAEHARSVADKAAEKARAARARADEAAAQVDKLR